MIGRLSGMASLFKDSLIILDCNGVGYLVECSTRTINMIDPLKPTKLTLDITTIVRDDAISLYGFSDPEEQRWFALLQKIPGVGAKLALNILSSLAPEFPGYFIARDDKQTFLTISGVGKKLAARLVGELKSHLVETDTISADKHGQNVPLDSQAIIDARSALINLGYSSKEAHQAVDKAYEKNSQSNDSAILIKAALQELRMTT